MSNQITKQQLKNLKISKNIILVTGSFDLLHKGHMYLFAQAKELIKDEGKLLVILLSDKQIQRRKGNNRPIHNVTERIKALNNIDEIDLILIWDEEWERLRDFLPEISNKISHLVVNKTDPGFVNKKKVAKMNGIKIKVFERMGEYSTTSIIEAL